jgi:DNA-directed RNA polymerase I subunit RPA49
LFLAVNLSGFPALAQRKKGKFSMYEGKLPSAKRKRCLVKLLNMTCRCGYSCAVFGKAALILQVTEMQTDEGPLMFAGRNFGEGSFQTAPTGYRYLVGVRNKKEGVVRLHRASLYNIGPVFSEEQDSKEPGLETETFAQKMSKITEAFGSEKRKRLMAASQRNKLDMTTLDATLAPAIEMAQEHVDKMNATGVSATSSLVPPCNTDAQTPEEVYDMEDIVTSNDLELLSDLSESMLSASKETLDEWRREERLPLFVMDRILLLSGSSNPSSLRRVQQLLYLSCLIMLFKQNPKDLYKNGPNFPADTPEAIRSGILERFATPAGKGRRSFQMTKLQKDHLLNYLLTFLLIVDSFSLAYTTLAQELKVTGTKMMTHLRCLGCSFIGSGSSKTGRGSDIAVLKIPLNFPKPKREKGKRTRN